MSTFIESPRFPDFVAYWASGGRGYSTQIVETLGGIESRNANWTMAKGKWNIAQAYFSCTPAVASFNHDAIIKMFRAARGQLYGFRFKDFRDYKDSDGGGTGVWAALGGGAFQMYKQYALSPDTELQIIQKPVSGTITVVGNTGGTINYNTGILTGGSGTPTSWTGQFDIPCRFDKDFPDLGPDPSGALSAWQSLDLIEIRDIA